MWGGRLPAGRGRIPSAAGWCACTRRTACVVAGSDRVADYVIAGAGIVGINIATVLRERVGRGARIVVVDKEPGLGVHASGRNSGVLHAGFYYAPDSLKAELTRRGNAFLTDYCTRHGLPLNRCGKLVVATREAEVTGLDTLYRRGAANGVRLEEVSAEQARRIEPLAATHGTALWSPTTSVGDPVAVLYHQASEMVGAGVQLRTGTRVTHVEATHGGVRVRLAGGGSDTLTAGHFINAAGLYADQLAHSMGFGTAYTLLPFVGLYMYVDLPLQRLVYPVPHLDRPFLGVHFTITADGKCKIGPTAIPALYRQQYWGEGGGRGGRATTPLVQQPLSSPPPPPVPVPWATVLSEMADIVPLAARMAWHDTSFRGMAWEEVHKYLPSRMQAGATALLQPGVLLPHQFKRYGKPGIRAQLVRRDTLSLEMDFVVEGDGTSTHILNAVSPGWTSSRPFAEYVVDRWVLPSRASSVPPT